MYEAKLSRYNRQKSSIQGSKLYFCASSPSDFWLLIQNASGEFAPRHNLMIRIAGGAVWVWGLIVCGHMLPGCTVTTVKVTPTHRHTAGNNWKRHTLTTGLTTSNTIRLFPDVTFGQENFCFSLVVVVLFQMLWNKLCFPRSACSIYSVTIVHV